VEKQLVLICYTNYQKVLMKVADLGKDYEETASGSADAYFNDRLTPVQAA
jgi:hypothetical protein